jgi:hypothetical protein
MGIRKGKPAKFRSESPYDWRIERIGEGYVLKGRLQTEATDWWGSYEASPDLNEVRTAAQLRCERSRGDTLTEAF